jgi:acetylornithine deacetylase/succinyl-diaminopimelate desuccinylase-like protein
MDTDVGRNEQMRATIARTVGAMILLASGIGLPAAAAVLAPAAAPTASPAAAAAEKQGLEIAERAIAFRSVEGAGNQTPQLAAYLKGVLVAGGFAPSDVEIVPVDDTAYLVARYRGRDRAAKPLILSGHMDVVEVKPADWQRDPFKPVVENGYLYGRGATDMKFGAAMMVATLVSLKREGFVPGRDIVLALSGDEETRMKTSAMLADRFPNAALVLNADGGGGKLSEGSGKPEIFSFDAAEKVYADYELTFTNPGGHSSMPRRANAIYSLAHALDRVGAYRFKPELSDITRASFTAWAERAPPPLAAAMRAFVANPADPAAIETLSADPAYVGKIGTTCVATMVSGGHALNALPQRATANVNCRIFPGHTRAAIMAELARAVGDPSMTIADVTAGSIATDPSPLRPDVTAAIRRAVAIDYAGVPVVPVMASGASDSMFYRAHGVPSYGIGMLFIKDSDDFSHGLNERTPVMNVAPAIRYYRSLVTDLSR